MERVIERSKRMSYLEELRSPHWKKNVGSLLPENVPPVSRIFRRSLLPGETASEADEHYYPKLPYIMGSVTSEKKNK